MLPRPPQGQKSSSGSGDSREDYIVFKVRACLEVSWMGHCIASHRSVNNFKLHLHRTPATYSHRLIQESDIQQTEKSKQECVK
jgi:hypothetical protein